MSGTFLEMENGAVKVSPPAGKNIILELASGGKVVVTGGLIKTNFQTITGDGAITLPDTGEAYVLLTKGSAAAITIAAPTVAQNGMVVHVMTTTGYAHVITCSTDGFNAKGSSGTATAATTFIGELILYADNGHWYTFGRYLWTIA